MQGYGKNNMENKELVIIRADASVQIGSGHVMRCLALAGQYRAEYKEVVFICREMPGNLMGFITEQGYEMVKIPHIETLPNDAWKLDLEFTTIVLKELKRSVDLLVVDHYCLDAKWEAPLRRFTKQIMVIDDLANRHHNCDILLDQNLYPDMESRYIGLVPTHCQMLLGPRYALLRPEFYEARKKLRARDGIVKQILIFFGGSDPTNETAKALQTIKMINRPDISVDVVVGINNPYKDDIQHICNKMANVTYYCQINNIADLMVKADLAIGAGGSTTWERCFLGLPTLIVVTANNQRKMVAEVVRKGMAWNLGESKKIGPGDLALVLIEVLKNPISIKIRSEAACNFYA